MSGRLFPDVEPIALSDYRRVIEGVRTCLWNAGAERIEPVGTSGLKETMGDIDLAVSHPGGRDGLEDALERHYQTKRVGHDLASFRFPCGSNRWVQVDCFVGNVDYIKWARAGDTTPGAKAAARAVLWNVIARTVSTTPGSRDRLRLALDFGSGLYEIQQTKVGKRGQVLKDWKTLSRRLITDDPQTIVSTLLGPGTNVQDVATFGGLLDAVKRMPKLQQSIVLSSLSIELDGLDRAHPGAYGDIDDLRRMIGVVIR